MCYLFCNPYKINLLKQLRRIPIKLGVLYMIFSQSYNDKHERLITNIYCRQFLRFNLNQMFRNLKNYFVKKNKSSSNNFTYQLFLSSLIHYLLDEILGSAVHRCLEASLMEPNAVEIICERG